MSAFNVWHKYLDVRYVEAVLTIIERLIKTINSYAFILRTNYAPVHTYLNPVELLFLYISIYFYIFLIKVIYDMI